MAPSKLRKAIGAVKDKTSIGLAKVGSITSLPELDVAIVKATRHEEHPAEERHIREILALTSYSRSYIVSCVSTISRRLNKTKNWVVALKTLMLIHRLLAEGDGAYEQEIFFSTRKGTRLLNMSDFRDGGRLYSWDYSAFVRTYALYLDEQLELMMQGKRERGRSFWHIEDGEEDGVEVGSNAIVVRETPVCEMTTEQVSHRVHHLMQLLERFLACRPTGLAKSNRIVHVALYPVVKESFQIFQYIGEAMSILIDRFTELDVDDSVKLHEILCRLSKQYNDLDAFYEWYKSVGIARSSEYPDVDKISSRKLDMMEEYIREKSDKQFNRNANAETMKETKLEVNEPEPEPETKLEPEEDMIAIKALPPTEGIDLFAKRGKEEEEENKNNQLAIVGDLLNLGEDAPSTEEHCDRLALALFDGLTAATPATGLTPWEAFGESGDWETALVQSSSHLSNQKASLPGGFDTLMLDGMYQHGAIAAQAPSPGNIATGSASSVAFGSAGRPALLALPAPPVANGEANNTEGIDPFAASLSMPPPAYVQMSDLEKKQRLLVEEQLMWQQYARDGMQGQVGLTRVEQNPSSYNKVTRTHLCQE